MLTDISSRLAVVENGGPCAARALHLRVADVELEILLDDRWSAGAIEVCQQHWRAFEVEPTLGSKVRITLSPARAPFLDANHVFWNAADPFQENVVQEGKEWLLHRDFTASLEEGRMQAWLPQPSRANTDALDNILTIALRHSTLKLTTFLLHAAVVEHRGAAVVFFGPSGIGKSTLAKLSHGLGFRVMSSDQVYLGLGEGRPWVAACPTANPDLPRFPESWVTEKLWVRCLFNLQRKGKFEVEKLSASEMSRRLFAELFCDLTSAPEEQFRKALAFAAQIAGDDAIFQGSLSYPRDFDFWPSLEKLGYI